MDNRERMIKGLPYISTKEGLAEERFANRKKIFEYNNCNPMDFNKQEELIRDILGEAGKGVWIEAPFHCDYGRNISVGDNFYANYNLVILDVAKVTAGDNVFIAPNVAIYTAGHPIHYELRNKAVEYGMEVTIGDNVWIGGNAVINPGVHVGSNVVIASGSIVTKDIPDNVVIAGNPAKVIKTITDEDKKYYFKDREFTKEDEEIFK